MPLITMIIMISGTGLGSPGLPRIGRKKWFCAETDSGSLWQWQWGLWGSSFKPQETSGEWSPYCKGKERDTVSELFLEVKDSELGVRISPMSQFCPLSTMDPITSKCWPICVTKVNTLFFFYFGTQGFMHARQGLYYLNYDCRSFVWILFLRQGLTYYTWPWTHDPPASVSQVAGIIGVNHHTQLKVSTLNPRCPITLIFEHHYSHL
jgi:hypothetical protein